MAVEGTSYFESAKRSIWALWSEHLYALCSLSLVEYIVLMGGILNGLVISGLSAIYVYSAHSSWSLVWIAGLLSLVIAIVVLSSLVSIVCTTFYCTAYYPNSTVLFVENYMDQNKSYAQSAQLILDSKVFLLQEYENPNPTRYREGFRHN